MENGDNDIVMAVDITDEVVTEDEALEDEDEAKEYRCETCLKVLKNKNSLKCHVSRAHKTKKDIICDICGFSFENGIKLSQHKVVVKTHEVT